MNNWNNEVQAIVQAIRNNEYREASELQRDLRAVSRTYSVNYSKVVSAVERGLRL